jgi:hypothetical protein
MSCVPYHAPVCPGDYSEVRTRETWAPSSGDSHYDSHEEGSIAAAGSGVCVCVCVCVFKKKSFYPSQNMLHLMVTAIFMNH